MEGKRMSYQEDIPTNQTGFSFPPPVRGVPLCCWDIRYPLRMVLLSSQLSPLLAYSNFVD